MVKNKCLSTTTHKARCRLSKKIFPFQIAVMSLVVVKLAGGGLVIGYSSIPRKGGWDFLFIREFLAVNKMNDCVWSVLFFKLWKVVKR